MDLDSAIKKVKDIFKLKRVKRFDKLYKFTTENISGYISEFSFKDRTLLTVGSSCDQVINANLYGCNDIIVVDLNGLAEYYFCLKKRQSYLLVIVILLSFFIIIFMVRSLIKLCILNFEELLVWLI